jgi:hypothetical protein
VPEITILLWLSSVAGATVPKTAINKNREFESGKNEIWLAKNLLIAPPTSDFMQAHQLCQRDFGSLISPHAPLT